MSVERLELNNGNTLVIDYDEFAESPREWCNLGIMVCNHGRYNLGDEHLEYHGVSFEDDLKQHLADKDLTLKDVIYLPLYLYDHSGITMNTTGFSCGWDSGQVGYIYVPKYVIRADYGVKRISKKLHEMIEDNLRAEVEIYDKYLTGDVYQWHIEDGDGDWLDSCSGYYDLEHCKEDALDSLYAQDEQEVA